MCLLQYTVCLKQLELGCWSVSICYHISHTGVLIKTSWQLSPYDIVLSASCSFLAETQKKLKWMPFGLGFIEAAVTWQVVRAWLTWRVGWQLCNVRQSTVQKHARETLQDATEVPQRSAVIFLDFGKDAERTPQAHQSCLNLALHVAGVRFMAYGPLHPLLSYVWLGWPLWSKWSRGAGGRWQWCRFNMGIPHRGRVIP